MRAVLTLHGIGPESDPLTLRPEELEAILDRLEATGHAVVPLDELLARPGQPDRVALVFDDAFASVADEALPVLARRDLVSTVFVVTSHVGSDTAWPGQPAGIRPRPTMCWSELQALIEAGWSLGSHTVSHPWLTRCDEETVLRELREASDTLLARTGRPPVAFAYPYGDVDDRLLGLVRHHHRRALGTRLAALDPAVDHPLDLPRIDAWYLRGPLLAALGTPAFLPLLALRRRAREWRASRRAS